jgi:hypothetical protein
VPSPEASASRGLGHRVIEGLGDDEVRLALQGAIAVDIHAVGERLANRH